LGVSAAERFQRFGPEFRDPHDHRHDILNLIVETPFLPGRTGRPARGASQIFDRLI